MWSSYANILCIHAFDSTTEFLRGFERLPVEYLIVEPDEQSILDILHRLDVIRGKGRSLIIFLGHGSSSLLYSPQTGAFARRTLINSTGGNTYFKNNDVLLLSCKSAEFIDKLSTYNQIIGFGNILSSIEEVSNDAEQSGVFRNLSKNDIEYFNEVYSQAIINCFGMTSINKIQFKNIPIWITYYINKEINIILRQMERQNRIELATLLFEFRNEMVYRSR